MKRVRIFLFTFIILIISCNENSSSYYDNYNELMKDDIIKRGWIPDFLPKDSKGIYEIHNIDINTIYGKFSYNSDLWVDSLTSQSVEYNLDSLNLIIAQINRPRRPKWFITDKELSETNPLILKTQDWIFITDTLTHKCYFVK